MRAPLSLIAMFLAAIWLPVTSHCAFEAAGVFAGGDACCAAGGDAQPTDHACAGDNCEVVEEGDYRISGDSARILAPAVAWLACVQYEIVVVCQDSVADISFFTESPPGMAATWHLQSRAAFPPRAPSGQS